MTANGARTRKRPRLPRLRSERVGYTSAFFRMASSAQSPRRERPIQFGKYTLLARIGGGGMGELFLAQLRSAGGFEKLVVIKRIQSHLTDKPEIVDMFVAEARTAARISHPNVCSVYELGQVDGRYYMALEYLEGLPLADVMVARKRAPQMADLRLVASLVTQTAEGLHHAHSLRDPDGESAHVVHRDINPRNVFVTSAGVAKVLDFGIVKVRGAIGQVQTGSVKGTYSYMAPEQLQGDTVDSTTDIFALGTILWEAVVGRRLFKRSSDLLTWRAIVEEPIPRPTKFRPDLPPDLDEAIMRALARPASERFQTARELAAAVEQSIRPLGAPLTTLAIAAEMEVAFAAELGAQRERVFAAHRRQEADRLGAASPGADPRATDASISDERATGGRPSPSAGAEWGDDGSMDEAVVASDSMDESVPTLQKIDPIIADGEDGRGRPVGKGGAGKGGAAARRKPATGSAPGVIDDWDGGGNDTRVAEPAYADLVSRMVKQQSQEIPVPAEPLGELGDDDLAVFEGPIVDSDTDGDADLDLEPETRPVAPPVLAAVRQQGVARPVALPRPSLLPPPPAPPSYVVAEARRADGPPVAPPVAMVIDEGIALVRPRRRWVAVIALAASAATGATLVLMLNGRGAAKRKPAATAAAPAVAASVGAGEIAAPAGPGSAASAAGGAGAPGGGSDSAAKGQAASSAAARGEVARGQTARGQAASGAAARGQAASGQAASDQAAKGQAAGAGRDAAATAAAGKGGDDGASRTEERETARERRERLRERRERRAEKAGAGERDGARPRDRQRDEASAASAAGAAQDGFLTINAEPYATVFVDGKKRGLTPLVRLGLGSGPHRLRLVSSGGQPDKKMRVRITPGQELRKSIKW